MRGLIRTGGGGTIPTNDDGSVPVGPSSIGYITHNREMPAAIADHAGGAETANHVTWTQAEEISRIIVHIFPTTPGALEALPLILRALGPGIFQMFPGAPPFLALPN